MRYKLINKSPETYAIIFENGDELASGLAQFATDQEITAASFKAIGALSSAELGWFDWDDKEYHVSVNINEQVELLSLIGDIAMKGDNPTVHAHMVIGKRDGSAHGGHLMKAVIRPTCEVILTVSPSYLTKHIDAESGLALIRP